MEADTWVHPAELYSARINGHCVCGAVRYRVEGEPVRNSVCSCTFCQRRTGSAAGFGGISTTGSGPR